MKKLLELGIDFCFGVVALVLLAIICAVGILAAFVIYWLLSAYMIIVIIAVAWTVGFGALVRGRIQ